NRQPDQLLWRRSSRMGVEQGSPFVEPPRVPGVPKSEAVEIEMVAELVAKRVQESSERGDLLAYRGFSPDADHERTRMIVAEKFADGGFSDLTRLRGKYAHTAFWHVIKARSDMQKLRGGVL